MLVGALVCHSAITFVALTRPAEFAVFHDVSRSHRDLEQLRVRLPADLYSTLLHLLSECADPDQALNLFERLTQANGAELIPLLDRERVLFHYILVLFGQSHWLSETILRDPTPVLTLYGGKYLQRSFSHDDFRQNYEQFSSDSNERDVAVLLASFRKREYVRIALRDMLGIATLAETTAELSALADVILEAALRETELQTRARLGSPPAAGARFAVLSLGKLGGNELNYSSDLDLLYLFSGNEPSSATGLREYFTRQAQLLTDILSRPTAEGAVFRVDLRLRPQGAEGELAAEVAQAAEYYAHAAHDWELQAFIKLRHSAGDSALAREFIAAVQPSVYTSNINFAAVETAVRSLHRISSHRRSRRGRSGLPGTLDVKLDRGGIRDIEFLVQCLQRVYGGEETWLRSVGTLFSLQKLHDKGHLSGRDFHELSQAYEFLRRLEHRLQLQRGQQTHHLPADPRALSVLQRALKSEFKSGDGGIGLAECTLAHMERVTGIYSRIIFSQRQKEKHGGKPPAPLSSFVREMSFEQILEQIARDSPALQEIAARAYPIRARRNLHRFLSSAMTESGRYAELVRNPAAVEKAITLFGISDYLTDILVRHPDAIRALDETDNTSREGVAISQCLGAHECPDVADSLDALRRSFHTAFFAIGARDVLFPCPALESMRESSALADEAIRQALAILGGQDTLAVFALGRLGTEEFDIASDADLLFVRAAETDADLARSTAEKLIHALAAYTREGAIFAVDARLRPHGKEGELVVTPAQMERYLAEEAQPWEALPYTKLRFVAGREDLASLLHASLKDRIVGLAWQPGFPRAVVEMRSRLEKSNRYPHSFKLARGGFYDIDFVASSLMLRHGSLCSGNTLRRLSYLCTAGFLEQPAFDQLHEAVVLYRTADHVIRLVTGRARPELPVAEHARQAVSELLRQILGIHRDSSIQERLNATATQVRAIFDNTFMI